MKGVYMNNNTYVVQKGDTLYGISRQFNTSMQRLRELNNLSSDNLSIGQVLIVSANSDSNPSECVTYTVKSGDSLYSIAQKYDTSIDKIKSDNKLSSNTLSIGQVLMIEDNTSTTVVEECFGEDEVLEENYIIYVVKSGDNLYSIARKYNTTVSEIKSLNNLTNNNLSIGQELKIPSASSVYIVKKGDSLYSIANMFNTTVNSIKSKNNLTSNNLSVGQELII